MLFAALALRRVVTDHQVDGTRGQRFTFPDIDPFYQRFGRGAEVIDVGEFGWAPIQYSRLFVRDQAHVASVRHFSHHPHIGRIVFVLRFLALYALFDLDTMFVGS